MFIVHRIARLSRRLQLALVAAAAFAIGSATVASAAVAGIPVGSLFYMPMINGTATTPCSTTATNTTTCNAVVDSNGNLHVSGTSSVTGSVGVTNFPGDQQVHGAVTGHVNVDNLPSTQTVAGTVNVGNLPTDANGNLKVAAQGAAAGVPIANKIIYLHGGLGAAGIGSGPNHSQSMNVNMKVTFISLKGCSSYFFYLTGNNTSTPLFFQSNGPTAFPIPVDISDLMVDNEDQVSGCSFGAQIVGY